MMRAMKIPTACRRASFRFVLLALALAALAQPIPYDAQRASRRFAAQAAPGPTPARVPLGFSPESYKTEERWEKRYLEIPDAANCGRTLRPDALYDSLPHS